MAHLKPEPVNNNKEVSEHTVIQPLFLDIWAVDEYLEYNSHKSTIVPQLEVGDEIWLKKQTQGYSHVLLYIGNEEVVHVSDVQKSGIKLGKTVICRDKLDDVAENKLIGCRKTLNLDDKDRAEIIQRALGDVGKLFPYLLTTDNCEHQVKYWISGVKDYRWMVSTQVRDYVVIASIGFVAGAGIGTALGITLWSTDAIDIAISCLGGGFLGVLAICAFKFIGTSLEYSSFCRG